MKLIIKNCSFKDIDKIRILSNSVIKTKFSTRKFEKILSIFPDLCLTAVLGNDIVGFLIATLSNDNIKNCTLYAMGVESKFMGHGIGAKLLNRLIFILRKKKVEIINLHVRESNVNAIDFYEKNGFKQVKKVKNFYPDGEHAVEMALMLT